MSANNTIYTTFHLSQTQARTEELYTMRPKCWPLSDLVYMANLGKGQIRTVECVTDEARAEFRAMWLEVTGEELKVS